ncbi:hypothetical protein [Paenibacillus sp. MBLB4367]|uniref:hypothetical protein n=1 Tax=Paenibacillus sp. MBLB4367 TaxID=3384767 RepID=UPI0039084566
MYKLILYMFVLAFVMTLHALQTDEELAMQTLFRAKHGVNYATHAAAQQLDLERLAGGVVALDPARAEATALQYVQRNLRLDTANVPQPGTFFKARVDVLTCRVVNADETFPYSFVHPATGYSVVLNRPGVILIVRLEYPRTFSVMGPIVWDIKSASEVVY